MTVEEIVKLGVRKRRTLNKDLLFKLGYCTDCGHVNDRTHLSKRTCSKCLEDASRYYQKNKEKRSAKLKQWANDNPEKYKAAVRNRGQRLKRLAFEAYGTVCQCCGESDINFLTIDHINGGGNEHRRQLRKTGGSEFYQTLRKLKYPSTPPMEVLCFNCNQGRRVNGGVCPHKERK